jgi:hypothetical protein
MSSFPPSFSREAQSGGRALRCELRNGLSCQEEWKRTVHFFYWYSM